MSILPDSGKRREVPTGSVREAREGKGRFDLLSFFALHELACHTEDGAVKYSDRNWEKGQPLSWYLDSAIRHLYKYLGGDDSENHIAAAMWNCMAFIHTREMVRRGALPKELDDLQFRGNYGQSTSK